MQITDVNAALSAHYGSEPLVFGQGPVPCSVMLIGEAPGAHEIEENMPFCGQAGKNLNTFLNSVHLDRSQLYITNVCKFRPIKFSASGRASNRTPTRKEIEEAVPFLLEEMICVCPRIAVTLGNTPLHALMADNSLPVGDVHGTCLASPRPELEGICIFSLYHPASLIYNPGLRTTYEQDLTKLRRRIGEICHG